MRGLPFHQRGDERRAWHCIVRTGIKSRRGEDLLDFAEGFDLGIRLGTGERTSSEEASNRAVVRSGGHAVNAQHGEGLVVEFASDLEVLGELETADRRVRHAARSSIHLAFVKTQSLEFFLNLSE